MSHFSWEDQGEGPTLLLVHGFPLDKRMWGAIAPRLAEVRRVVAMDLPGFGDSTTSMNLGGVCTMAQYADHLAEFLDDQQVDQVDLAGLSMGGYVAMEFVRRHGGRVRSLVLLNTRSEPDTPEAARDRWNTADAVEREGAGELAQALVKKLLSNASAERNPDLVAQLLDWMQSAAPTSIAAALRGMAERADASAWLDSLPVPTLVVAGEQDVITPPDGMRRLADRMHARFALLPEVGHLSPLEAADQVGRELETFLSDHQP